MRRLLFLLPLLLGGCAAKAVLPEPIPVMETVQYRSGKEAARGVLYHPAEAKRFPAVVLVHGDDGLTDWVKSQAERLAKKGYVALAVDLYRGEAVNDLMDAHILGRGLDEDRALADLKAAVDYLTERPDVCGDAIGIIGWDLGGGYALDAAIHDSRLRAAVVCYGRLTTEPAVLAPLSAAVLGIFAGKDEGIRPETIERFRRAMEKANKRLAGLHTYPSCAHGFMNPSAIDGSGPAEPGTIADAWDRIETFFADELGNGHKKTLKVTKRKDTRD